jgi:hypothetical protein
MIYKYLFHLCPDVLLESFRLVETPTDKKTIEGAVQNIINPVLMSLVFLTDFRNDFTYEVNSYNCFGWWRHQSINLSFRSQYYPEPMSRLNFVLYFFFR